MHSNELQTGYREYRERSGDRRSIKGDAGSEQAGGIKTNARDTTSVTERGTSDTAEALAGGCKGEEGDNKRRRIGVRNKSKMVEVKTAVEGANAKSKDERRTCGLRNETCDIVP